MAAKKILMLVGEGRTAERCAFAVFAISSLLPHPGFLPESGTFCGAQSCNG
jgi:hypothetical protein